MIVFFISLIAVIITIIIYARTISIALLRFFAIILLFLSIIGFTIPIHRHQEATPIMLVDRSASMSRVLPDVQRALENVDYPHSLLYFAESLYTQTVAESVLPGRATDIAGSVLAVAAEGPPALLLVSDGNHNYGDISLAAIRDVRTPVHTFGIGARSNADIAIHEVRYPQYAYLGDSVVIEVILQTQGFSEGSARILLRAPGATRDRTEVFRLSHVKAKQSIEFKTCIARPDQSEYRIIIPVLPEEVNTVNNSFDFKLKIIDKKITILYFTEHLSFNTEFIMNALRSDKRLSVHGYMKMPSGAYRKIAGMKSIPLPRLPDTLDVLILDNVRYSHLPWTNTIERIKEGVGVLCLGSMTDLTPKWREIIPIQTAEAVIQGVFNVSVLTPFSCLDPGTEYPPIHYINRVTGVQDNATILAESKSIPLMGYCRYGQGVLFQMNTVDLGVWQFLQMGLRQHDVLGSLLTDIVRFLSHAGRNQRLVLSTLTDTYLKGEMIPIILQSFDRDFKRRGGGDFLLSIDGELTPVFEEQTGIYTTSIIAAEKGELLLIAQGSLDDEELTSNQLSLTIREGTLEQETGLNEDYLRTLSAKTGGKYFPLDSLDTFDPQTRVETTIMRFHFDTPLTLIVICILLAVDWIIRRRKGIV